MTLLWTEGDSPEDSWVVCSGEQLTESPVIMKPSSNEKQRLSMFCGLIFSFADSPSILITLLLDLS
ncbi:hypothetical protein STEG23_034885, partial [Scotinomys teguina]